jgi:hypothetical protein
MSSRVGYCGHFGVNSAYKINCARELGALHDRLFAILAIS